MRMRVTIRAGWEEEVSGKPRLELAARKEALETELSRYVPPGGKLDIDIRLLSDSDEQQGKT